MLSTWKRPAERLRGRGGPTGTISMNCGWLGNLDSNQDKQSQSLLCYRYTIPQLLNDINTLDECLGNLRQQGRCKIALRAGGVLLLAWSGPWQAWKEAISGQNARGVGEVVVQRSRRDGAVVAWIGRMVVGLIDVIAGAARQWRMKSARFAASPTRG